MCLEPFGANRQISREYVLELLKYHNKESLFRNLLEKKPADKSPHSNDSQQENTVEVPNKLEDVQCLGNLETTSNNSLTKIPRVGQEETKANYAFSKKRKRVE